MFHRSRALAGSFLFCLLAGCASTQDFFNILFGNNVQKITRTPIWLYKPDLMFTLGSKQYSGFAVTELKNQVDISVDSAVNIDRVEISSCSRHDVCQYKGGDIACDIRTSDNPLGRFEIDHDWFSNPGKRMTYHFMPDRKERDDSCSNLYFAIYDQNSLASWGFLILRDHPDTNFRAKFTCNAIDWNYSGVSACSAKAGTYQEINFDGPIDSFRAEDSCGMTQVSPTEFEFQPTMGWCRASFMRAGKFHDVVLNGYDEVLVRGKSL